MRNEQNLLQSKRPTVFQAFGATGNVARLKLYPALYHLAAAKLLPEQFYILGISRRGLSDAAYQKYIAATIREQVPGPVNRVALKRLTDKARYFAGNLSESEVYKKSEAFVQAEERRIKKPIQRIFYLGLPPSVFPHVFKNVQTCKLGSSLCTLSHVLSRVIIEKPFGFDSHSSRQQERQLRKTFDERQIYRMDHFLGKEALQNILLFRFGNSIFDELWHGREIRAIQITAIETLGVENRANYYESAGALRDVVQNHLLQMLSYATMSQPKNFSPQSVHAEKEKILRATRILPGSHQKFVRGQYDRGRIDGRIVPGYRAEPGVPANSMTETYAAMQLGINTPNWRGVPVYLRTGKRMSHKMTEISYLFRRSGDTKFLKHVAGEVRSSFISIRLDPDPGISIRVNVKRPGHSMELVPADLHFCYEETFGVKGVGAYDRLLLEVIEGNRLLFASSTEVKESWRIVEPALKAFKENTPPLHRYTAGSNGPGATDAMLNADGEHWLNETFDICKQSHG